MATAVIKVNGVIGSNFDLPINTVVNLSNNDNTGATTWTWSIISQPPGTTDSLVGGATSTPTFTPKKEGSYLIKLDVNGGGGGLTDTQVCAIKFLKTRLRAPAAGETAQQDATHGWETERYLYDQRLDNLYGAEFGVIVGVAGSAGLTRGQVLQMSGTAVIKNTLPGAETLPSFTLASGTSSIPILHTTLGVLEGGVDGSSTPASGAVIRVRIFGRFTGITGTPTVDTPVFVNDAGALVTGAIGTRRRQVGFVLSNNGTTFDLWVDAAQLPMEDKRLVGITSGLVSTAGDRSLDLGALSSSFALVSASDAVVPLTAKKNSGVATADIFDALDQNGVVMSAIDKNGSIVMSQAANQAVTKTSGSLTIGTGDANNLFFKINAVNRWQIDGNGILRNLTNNAAITSDATTLFQLGTSAAQNLEFFTANVNNWRILGDGTNNLAGIATGTQSIVKSNQNLKIGTTGAFDLEILGNSTTNWLFANAGNLTAQLAGAQSISKASGALNISSAAAAVWDTAGSLTIGTRDANSLIFKTNAGTRWTMDSSGNLSAAAAATVQTSAGALTLSGAAASTWDSAGGLTIGTRDATSLIFKANNVTQVTITATTFTVTPNAAFGSGLQVSGGGSYSLSAQATAGNNGGAWAAGIGSGEGLRADAGASGPAAILTPGSSNVRGALHFNSQSAPSAPTNGDMWFDGTALWYRAGGTTFAIAHV